MNDTVLISLISTIGVVIAPVMLAVVNHILKENAEDRDLARRALNAKNRELEMVKDTCEPMDGTP